MEALAGRFAARFVLSEEEKFEVVCGSDDLNLPKPRFLLVGQVMSLKPICRNRLLSTLKPLWKDENLRIGSLGGGRLLFEATFEVIKQRVLDGCSRSFDKSLIVLADANGKGPPSSIPLTHEKFWVQIHGLDPNDT
ncbi:hypothetical protein M0R45_001337 [Rubus argutus]|uniref:DUF4780 domain-containing protein n=1 Tax=Rubus argutus TaxID=59490 RepID=A0AAW1VH92_RUBAR